MSINPLANRPRADACGFGNGLRRLSARDLPYNALSTARRQPGILMHVHPVLPWNLKLQQPQLPRSEPDGQPTESSQLACEPYCGLACCRLVQEPFNVLSSKTRISQTIL